jgi:hypothetical protein
MHDEPPTTPPPPATHCDALVIEQVPAVQQPAQVTSLQFPDAT